MNERKKLMDRLPETRESITTVAVDPIGCQQEGRVGAGTTSFGIMYAIRWALGAF